MNILHEKLNNIIDYKLEKINTNLLNLISKLEILNPLSVLKKGYSVVYKDNEVIKNITKLSKNDIINIRLFEGEFIAKVEEIKK